MRGNWNVDERSPTRWLIPVFRPAVAASRCTHFLPIRQFYLHETFEIFLLYATCSGRKSTSQFFHRFGMFQMYIYLIILLTISIFTQHFDVLSPQVDFRFFGQFDMFQFYLHSIFVIFSFFRLSATASRFPMFSSIRHFQFYLLLICHIFRLAAAEVDFRFYITLAFFNFI